MRPDSKSNSPLEDPLDKSLLKNDLRKPKLSCTSIPLCSKCSWLDPPARECETQETCLEILERASISHLLPHSPMLWSALTHTLLLVVCNLVVILQKGTPWSLLAFRIFHKVLRAYNIFLDWLMLQWTVEAACFTQRAFFHKQRTTVLYVKTEELCPPPPPGRSLSFWFL